MSELDFADPDADIDRNQIERRVDDWLDRLNELRTEVSNWLQTYEGDLQLVELPFVTMNEEMMRKFEVPPRELPSYEVRSRENVRLVRIRPRALWIVGANGRVDITTKVSAPILVDKSKPLSRPSNWQLFDSRGRQTSTQFTAVELQNLIEAAHREPFRRYREYLRRF